MKKAISTLSFSWFVLVIIHFFGCKEPEKVRCKTFLKRHFSLSIDTTVEGTVYNNGKFITLLSDGKCICINANDYKVDSMLSVKLSKKKIDGFYQLYDSLIVMSKNKDFYLNDKFEYEPYHRYSHCYYKKDTSIVYDFNGSKFIDPLYIDSNYAILQFCEGEFGGTLYFFNLKTNREYYCPATCGTVVNKVGDVYVITNSLVHMRGSSEVLLISDPRTLPEVDFDTLKYLGNFWYEKAWDGQSHKRYNRIVASMRGTGKQLLDTTGALIYSSFVNKNEVYHIYRSGNRYNDSVKIKNPNEIYIGIVRNKKLHAIDSLGEVPIFTYYPKSRIYKDLTLYSYSHDENSGFLAIQGDVINIFEYKVKNKKMKE